MHIHKWLRWVIVSFIQWLILMNYISAKNLRTYEDNFEEMFPIMSILLIPNTGLALPAFGGTAMRKAEGILTPWVMMWWWKVFTLLIFFSFGALWFIITRNKNVVGNIVWFYVDRENISCPIFMQYTPFKGYSVARTFNTMGKFFKIYVTFECQLF